MMQIVSFFHTYVSLADTYTALLDPKRGHLGGGMGEWINSEDPPRVYDLFQSGLNS